MRSLAAAALALLLLAPAAGSAQETPPPAPVPAPTPAPSAPPPSPSPSAAPSASPTASASPYRFVLVPPPPPPGQPVILEIDMLDSTLHAGGPYSVRVKTSLDVTSLTVTAMGGTYGMQAAGPGLFATDGQIPSGIPFFLLNRSFGITVTASTTDGRSTSVPLTLRLER